MLKTTYDTDLSNIVDDSEALGTYPETDFGRLADAREWTATQTFSHATPITLDAISERTEDAGVTITGNLMPEADITRNLGAADKRMAIVYTVDVRSGATAMVLRAPGIYIDIDGVFRWIITGAPVPGHIHPYADNAYDIGSGGVRVRDFHAVTLHGALTTAELTGHDKAAHDALNIDADTLDAYHESSFGRLAAARTWTTTQTFSHATPIKLDSIAERSAGVGVTVDSLLIKDGDVLLQDGDYLLLGDTAGSSKVFSPYPTIPQYFCVQPSAGNLFGSITVIPSGTLNASEIALGNTSSFTGAGWLVIAIQGTTHPGTAYIAWEGPGGTPDILSIQIQTLCADGLAVKYKTGAHGDGDYDQGLDGTIGVDDTGAAERIYFRAGGSWYFINKSGGLTFQERTCPLCDETFKIGDELKMVIDKDIGDSFHSVPAHLKCNVNKDWVEDLLKKQPVREEYYVWDEEKGEPVKRWRSKTTTKKIKKSKIRKGFELDEATGEFFKMKRQTKAGYLYDEEIGKYFNREGDKVSRRSATEFVRDRAATEKEAVEAVEEEVSEVIYGREV